MTSPQPRLHPLRATWLALILACGAATAERLPVRTYTVADGLAANKVHRIVQDRRGFLWLGTIEGLSRFDGRQFRNFGLSDGLPSAFITALAESASGEIWVGTDAGLCRIRAIPLAGSICDRFEPGNTERSLQINDIAAAPDGRLWIATNDGMFLIRTAEGTTQATTIEPIDLSGVFLHGRPHSVFSIHLAADHTLWCGVWGAAVHLDRDARLLARIETPQSFDSVNQIDEDLHGTLWLATRVGLARVRHPQSNGSIEFVRAAPNPERELPLWINQLTRDRRGHLWTVGAEGLAEVDPERDDTDPVHRYGAGSGLCGGTMETVFEDRESNLWVGSSTCGLLKLERTGLVAFGESDGIPERSTAALIEDHSGAICALTRIDHWFCNSGDRFVAVTPRGLEQLRYLGWSWNQSAVQDRTGAWWLAAGSELVRYPPLERAEQLTTTAPLAKSRGEPLLLGNDVFRVFEDSRGDLWIGFAGGGERLLRWDRATETFHRPTLAPEAKLQQPSCFAEDPRGRVWIGFRGGDLLRAERDRLQTITLATDRSAGSIESLIFDHAGRLWIATGQNGLLRVDNPSEASSRPRRYGREQGMVSDEVNTVVEGADHRIYAGTISGLDVLDPESERLQHFTTADGLANDWIGQAMRDRQGRLWFGTLGGLSRFMPESPPAPAPPPIFITGLDVNGVAQPISVRGESGVTGLNLGPGETTVRIDVSGLSFAAGGRLRFEHRFEGEEWSTSSDQPSVTLARISPGSYRVQLRALRPDGVASDAPASVAFVVHPPFWRTWWFALTFVLIVVALVVAFYRARIRQLIAVERMRTRIAMDLHDDVGSSLSQIALRSELALSRLERGEGDASVALEQISGNARSVVDAMNDVVWSVDPRHDLLSDLVRRIRAFALDAMESSDVEIHLALPHAEQELALSALLRRQIYLVFKECLNNALRHAEATRIAVTLTIAATEIELTVRDDGAGFSTDDNAERAEGATPTLGGHGLASMRERAAACGGTLSIETVAGSGTTVTLRVPIDR